MMPRKDPILWTLVGGLSLFAVSFVGVACTEPAATGGAVETTSTTAGMTFAECQRSGEYPGGRYAVSFDNGVCTVQR